MAQIVYFILSGLSILIFIVGKNNWNSFKYSFISYIFAIIIDVLILNWGGFFSLNSAWVTGYIIMTGLTLIKAVILNGTNRIWIFDLIFEILILFCVIMSGFFLL